MSIRRHTAYNLVGSVIPILLSLGTVPIYLKLVGADRYGVLAIAWLLLGYFGLFDLGLGRATSFRIAALRDAEPQARADTFWAALGVNVAMGAIGGLVLYFAAGYFFQHVFKVEERLRPEMLAAVPLLAAAVPMATLTGVLTGAMQGRERFLEINMISVFSTALFQLLPLAIGWRFGPNLVWLLAGALSARLLAALVIGARCYVELARGRLIRLRKSEITELLKYGGWVSLTSIFGPMLITVDRFAIGAVLGAVAVTDYTVPFLLAARMQVFPNALTTALFPRLSAATPEEQNVLGRKAMLTLASLLTLPFLGVIFAIEPFLHIWVGKGVGPQSGTVGRILLVSMWANALALIPFSKLQASGRPDIVTKVLLLEIPPYFALLYVAMATLGLRGAAISLCLRSIADFGLLTWNAQRKFDDIEILVANLALLVIGAVVAGLWPIIDLRFWLAAAVLGSATAALGWRTLPTDIREQLLGRVRAMSARGLALLRP